MPVDLRYVRRGRLLPPARKHLERRRRRRLGSPTPRATPQCTTSPSAHSPCRTYRNERHRRTERHHDLKGHVDNGHRWPLIARKFFQSSHHGVRIVESEQRQSSRNLEREARLLAAHVRPAANA